MSIQFVALPTDYVRARQAGAPDANGQAPELHVSDGDGVPCRHCLKEVAAGEPYLVLAHRPFPAPQPYAEQGPIFLHADECPGFGAQDQVPPVIAARKEMIVRGYSADDRIAYGSGRVVATADLREAAQRILADPAVAYVHVRSASNNCYLCRIERG
jgi:hypothetical protein